MTHRYDQATGEWSHPAYIHAVGYSGAGPGKNNPADQTIQGIGPIPKGMWTIGAPHDNPHTGPFTMDLTPAEGTETFGRTLFRIHGDSVSAPGTASHGCIILPRAVRAAIWASGDHTVEVV